MSCGLRLGRFSLVGEPGQVGSVESCRAIGAVLSGAYCWERTPWTGSTDLCGVNRNRRPDTSAVLRPFGAMFAAAILRSQAHHLGGRREGYWGRDVASALHTPQYSTFVLVRQISKNPDFSERRYDDVTRSRKARFQSQRGNKRTVQLVRLCRPHTTYVAGIQTNCW